MNQLDHYKFKYQSIFNPPSSSSSTSSTSPNSSSTNLLPSSNSASFPFIPENMPSFNHTIEDKIEETLKDKLLNESSSLDDPKESSSPDQTRPVEGYQLEGEEETQKEDRKKKESKMDYIFPIMYSNLLFLQPDMGIWKYYFVILKNNELSCYKYSDSLDSSSSSSSSHSQKENNKEEREKEQEKGSKKEREKAREVALREKVFLQEAEGEEGGKGKQGDEGGDAGSLEREEGRGGEEEEILQKAKTFQERKKILVKKIEIYHASIRMHIPSEKAFAFQIVTDDDIFIFSSNSPEQLFSWINSIRVSIERMMKLKYNPFYLLLSKDFSLLNQLPTQIHQQSASLQGNESKEISFNFIHSFLHSPDHRICSDCSNSFPCFFLINFSIFICFDCLQIHKQIFDSPFQFLTIERNDSDHEFKNESENKLISEILSFYNDPLFFSSLPLPLLSHLNHKPSSFTNFNSKLNYIQLKYNYPPPLSTNYLQFSDLLKKKKKRASISMPNALKVANPLSQSNPGSGQTSKSKIPTRSPATRHNSAFTSDESSKFLKKRRSTIVVPATIDALKKEINIINNNPPGPEYNASSPSVSNSRSGARDSVELRQIPSINPGKSIVDFKKSAWLTLISHNVNPHCESGKYYFILFENSISYYESPDVSSFLFSLFLHNKNSYSYYFFFPIYS